MAVQIPGLGTHISIPGIQGSSPSGRGCNPGLKFAHFIPQRVASVSAYVCSHP